MASTNPRKKLEFIPSEEQHAEEEAPQIPVGEEFVIAMRPNGLYQITPKDSKSELPDEMKGLWTSIARCQAIVKRYEDEKRLTIFKL